MTRSRIVTPPSTLAMTRLFLAVLVLASSCILSDVNAPEDVDADVCGMETVELGADSTVVVTVISAAVTVTVVEFGDSTMVMDISIGDGNEVLEFWPPVPCLLKRDIYESLHWLSTHTPASHIRKNSLSFIFPNERSTKSNK